MANAISLEEILDNIYLPFPLKTEQKRVLRALANGKNVFALLPTGYGKSICYGVFGQIMDKIDPGIEHKIMVISPLKSLMRDQVKRWTDLGIPAAAITSDMEKDTAMRIRSGEFQIIFMSPEVVLQDPWWSWLKSTKAEICLLAIDEVHCMSTWGSSFRPDYLKVPQIRSVVTAPVLMLTATVTESMATAITELMHLSKSTVETIAVVPDRPNIHLEIQRCPTEDFTEQVGWLVQQLGIRGKNADKTIVYCRTITTVTKVYGEVMDVLGECAWDGHKCIIEMYHSHTDAQSQKDILEDFPRTDSTVRCVIATVAFGLGVEVSDVRHVIHWGPSNNLLSYWQEVGRCSRDSAPGNARLYVFPRSMPHNIIDQSMFELVDTKTCYRKTILDFLFVNGMNRENIRTACNRKGCCLLCDETYE